MIGCSEDTLKGQTSNPEAQSLMMDRLEGQSDAELLELSVAGEESALLLLYERLKPSIFRYAFYMTNSKTAAEEVTQEVFISLLKGSGNVTGRHEAMSLRSPLVSPAISFGASRGANASIKDFRVMKRWRSSKENRYWNWKCCQRKLYARKKSQRCGPPSLHSLTTIVR